VSKLNLNNISSVPPISKEIGIAANSQNPAREEYLDLLLSDVVAIIIS
jgi:hypothetical protein